MEEQRKEDRQGYPSNYELERRLYKLELLYSQVHEDLQAIKKILLAIAGFVAIGIGGAFLQWVLRGGLGGP